MDCPRSEELLPAFVAGELDQLTAGAMNDHLTQCDDCRLAHDVFLELENALQLRADEAQGSCLRALDGAGFPDCDLPRRSRWTLPLAIAPAALTAATIFVAQKDGILAFVTRLDDAGRRTTADAGALLAQSAAALEPGLLVTVATLAVVLPLAASWRAVTTFGRGSTDF